MENTRRIAIKIIDMLEELLDKHDITIPDEYREGHEHESRIFGSTYFELEDNIASLLEIESSHK